MHNWCLIVSTTNTSNEMRSANQNFTNNMSSQKCDIFITSANLVLWYTSSALSIEKMLSYAVLKMTAQKTLTKLII